MTRILTGMGAVALALMLTGCPSESTKAPEKPATGAGSSPAANAKPTADAGAAKKPEKAPTSNAASAPAFDAGAAGKASVFFVWPEEGSKVFEAFHVVFGVTGKTISPAGEAVEDKNTGHHHLIIDGAAIPEGQVVPADDKHIHFGKGQTETDVTLSPGKHTLTMQFADGAHRSYGPAMSKTINIEVVAPSAERKVFFIGLKDGDKVKSPLKVKFGVTGFNLQPAGENPADKTTGHHHVIVDGKALPMGQVVPADDKHIHFGKGQTEAELTLTPGKHTLTMQLADGAHRSYGPNLSSTITVEVE